MDCAEKFQAGSYLRSEDWIVRFPSDSVAAGNDSFFAGQYKWG